MSKYKIDKGDVIGYLIIEPNSIKVHYKEEKKTRVRRRNVQIIISPKTGKKKEELLRKKEKTSLRQTGFFLNRYYFAYAGRDTVNQVGKVAPKLSSHASGEINKIAKQRTDQILRLGGAEIERVAPKIIKGAIEEVYKTPF